MLFVRVRTSQNSVPTLPIAYGACAGVSGLDFELHKLCELHLQVLGSDQFC